MESNNSPSPPCSTTASTTPPPPPPSPDHYHSRSALVFSGALVQHLENLATLRLPSTYIGVRRVRPTSHLATRKRKRGLGNDNDDDDDDDDAWVPNDVIGDDGNPPAPESGRGRVAVVDERGGDDGDDDDPKEVVYKVTDPDGTQRRMTRKEKKQLKYELSRAKRDARKEERQRQHDGRIKEAKAGKRERVKAKKLAWREKQRQRRDCEGGEVPRIGGRGDDGGVSGARGDDVRGRNQVPKKEEEQKPRDTTSSPSSLATAAGNERDPIDEELATLRGERRGIPPVMLTPAATLVAQDCGGLPLRQGSPHPRRNTPTTVMDPILSARWASELQQSMVPAETSREKEDMRPMAYRLVPEVWKRLCPNSLWAPSPEGAFDRKNDAEPAENAAEKEIAPKNNQANDEPKQQEATVAGTPTTVSESSHSLALLRNPSPSYDEDAYAIFRHLHQHSDLHIACGALFGCDFLLYDGRREDRHSFAGLRMYSTDGNSGLPVPSAYDMAGFVRAMNTARKIALVATVARDAGGGARVAVVDLALEKVLAAPTHARRGRADARRSEEEAASGLAKTR